MCYLCLVPRKTITANVSLPPEIHAWVKAKIASILEVEPAANPTFTSVVSQALRQAMNEERERAVSLAENPGTTANQGEVTSGGRIRYEVAKPVRKAKKG
jgi:hypothetical protein